MFMDQWIETLRAKQNDLRLIADWASQVGLGAVRDSSRTACYEIEREIMRAESLKKQAASTLQRGDGRAETSPTY